MADILTSIHGREYGLDANGLPVWNLQDGTQVYMTVEEWSAVQSLVSGGGISVAPSFLGVYGGVTMDAGSGLVMPTMGVVVNAATDVIAAQQIDDAGDQVFYTTVNGGSSVGEVMILTTGSVPITSLHIGHSDGTSATVSADATITTNELVKFTFDAADEVTAVRITFSPPRSSGRYIDVHCVGQQVSA